MEVLTESINCKQQMEGPGDTMDQRTELDMEMLVERYGEGLYKLCCMFLSDAALAEDAVQETFIKAMEKYHTLENPEREKSWIYRIAANICKNYLRGNWFKRVMIGVEVEQADQVNITTDFIKKEQGERLFHAVSHLKPKLKEVILLYYYHDFSTVEIAGILEVNGAAVRKRMSRGKEELRKQLEGVEFYG